MKILLIGMLVACWLTGTIYAYRTRLKIFSLADELLESIVVGLLCAAMGFCVIGIFYFLATGRFII